MRISFSNDEAAVWSSEIICAMSQSDVFEALSQQGGQVGREGTLTVSQESDEGGFPSLLSDSSRLFADQKLCVDRITETPCTCLISCFNLLINCQTSVVVVVI